MQKTARIWWIEREGAGRLGIMSRPDPKNLEADLQTVKGAGVDEVISLLTTDEVHAIGLDEEANTARELGLKFKRFGLQDHGVPTIDRGLNDFLRGTMRDLQTGKTIVVHCNSGKGRSGLIVGALLTMQGMDADEAMKLMRSARHSRVPEHEAQDNWLRDFALQFHPLVKRQPESDAIWRLRMALVAGVVGVIGAAWFLTGRGVGSAR